MSPVEKVEVGVCWIIVGVPCSESGGWGLLDSCRCPLLKRWRSGLLDVCRCPLLRRWSLGLLDVCRCPLLRRWKSGVVGCL